MADEMDPAIKAFLDAGIDLKFDPKPVSPPSLAALAKLDEVPNPSVYPSVNRWPYRGWCLDVAPGVYLKLEGLNWDHDAFTIVDYTVGSMRGREWNIRYDHLDSDFAEFWEEFQMLQELRAQRKPLQPEEPTGTWEHGEDGMSVWVPFRKDDEEEQS